MHFGQVRSKQGIIIIKILLHRYYSTNDYWLLGNVILSSQVFLFSTVEDGWWIYNYNGGPIMYNNFCKNSFYFNLEENK